MKDVVAGAAAAVCDYLGQGGGDRNGGRGNHVLVTSFES